MLSGQPPQFKDPVEEFDCCDPELVIGLVCAVGTDYGPIISSLTETLSKFGYSTRTIRISNLIPTLTDCALVDSPEIARIDSYMKAGNQGCRDSGRKDLWALAAIADINAAREKTESGKAFSFRIRCRGRLISLSL